MDEVEEMMNVTKLPFSPIHKNSKIMHLQCKSGPLLVLQIYSDTLKI